MKQPLKELWMVGLICLLFICLVYFLVFCCFPKQCHAEEVWTITAYDACKKCCGKTDGITASGKKACYGMVACNWLPFGTRIKIEGLGVFVVADRGAKSLFGDKKHHIKHLDVYFPTHKQAKKFGVKYLEVSI
jgi:3D (Asp-Asp-Asp) domain-containing protein